MSVDIVQVFSRQDTSNPWWHDSFPPGHLEYFQEHFIGPGLYTGTREVSADGLLLIVTHSFADAAAREKFITDPYLLSCVPMRDAHNEANGITKIM